MTAETSSARAGGVGRSPSIATGRRVLALVGVSLGALLLSACTGSSPSNGPSEPAGEPQKGGTLRVAISDGDSSESLDPGLTLATNQQAYMNAIYDPLVTVDKDNNVVPGLAESWEVTPDAKEWTFHLREGVTWHDGSEFSSADVVATAKRWVDPETGSAMLGTLGAYLDASGISAPDASTVVLKLKKPYAALPAAIAGNFSNKITKAGTTEFTVETAIGTGPFKLTAWTPGTSWSAVRNDAYWGGPPYLDGLQVTVTPDQGAKLQGIMGGSSDVTDTIPVSLWASLEGASNAKLEMIEAKNSFIFAFDQRQAPFDDARVIEAIKLGTDREVILKTALQGHGVVLADLAVNPDSPYYPEGLEPEYDPEKAKSLLAEAGFPDGIDIELSTNPDLPGMLDVAQAWQQTVKDAGIRVNLKQYPLSTYWTDAYMGTPAFMDYWNRYAPEGLFDLFYKSDAVFGVSRFDDPELDSMVEAIQGEVDETKRIALTQRALLRAREKFGILIPVYADAAFAHSDKVNGVVWNYADSLDFRKAWLQ